jgi:hypothetical protein
VCSTVSSTPLGVPSCGTGSRVATRTSWYQSIRSRAESGQLGHGIAVQALSGGHTGDCLGASLGEALPRPVRVGAQPCAQRTELGPGQQCGVVLRMALAGQPVAPDGVGDDHRRAGVVDRGERLAQADEVVPAEVTDRLVQVLVGDISEQRAYRLGVQAGTGQLVMDLGGAVPQQPSSSVPHAGPSASGLLARPGRPLPAGRWRWRQAVLQRAACRGRPVGAV